MQTKQNKKQWKTVAIYVDVDSAEILTKEKFYLNYKKLETLKSYERNKTILTITGRKQGEQLSIFD